MRGFHRWISLAAVASLAACAGGSAPDLSALDDPQSTNAFVLATAEVADFNCDTKSLEIGRKQDDGTYRQVARVTVGTAWAPGIGVQTSLPPGTYHIVGMICMTKGNKLTVIPGRREASAVPFDPIYQDSIAEFTVAAREVISLGSFRFKLAGQPPAPFAVVHAALSPETAAAAKQALPKLRDRLAERAPSVISRSVGGRCVAGNSPMDCSELGKIGEMCSSTAPPGSDVAVVALRARLKAILCG